MSSNIINLLWESFLETILMVGVSGGLGAAIGIPLGVFLFVTSPKGIMPKPYVNRIIGTIVKMCIRDSIKRIDFFVCRHDKRIDLKQRAVH